MSVLIAFVISAVITLVLIGGAAFAIWATFEKALTLRRRWLRWTVTAGFAVILGGATLICAGGYVVSRAVHREIERIASSGEPVTLEDLSQKDPLVDAADVDAGRYYAAAIELRIRDRQVEESEALGEIRKQLLGGERPRLSPDQRAAIRALLEKNSEAIVYIDRATAVDQCERAINAERNSFFLINGLGGPRSLANLAGLRVTAQLIDEEYDQAADSARAVLRTHRMVKPDSLIGFMVKVAIVSLGAQYTVAISHYGGVSDERLTGLDAELRRTEESLSFAKALEGERVVGLYLQGLTPGASPAPHSAAWPMPWPMNRVVAADYLRHLREAIDAARLPFPASVEAMDNVRPRGLFAGVLHPSFERAGVLTARSYALIRAARLALAMARFRQEHGATPESVGAVAPTFIESVPLDPFDGRPMKFKREGDQIVIYSIGEDGKDDGGAVDRDDGKEPADWGYRLKLGGRAP